MDPFSLFSAEELSVWADRGITDALLSLTGLSLKFGALIAFLATGLHLALRRVCQRTAAWLYRRARGARLGQRLGLLSRAVRRIERLGGSGAGAKPERWLIDALYPVVFLLLWALMMLPLAFFRSYVLGHERQMSTISLELWWLDWLRGAAINFLLGALLGLGLFGLARRLPRTWWLWLWGAAAGMLVLWSMLSPVRAKIYNEFSPLPEGATRRAIEELMHAAGLKLEMIKVVDTSRRSKHASAYLMGEGPTRTVVLSDNLVDQFHPREIRLALAHELGHRRHEHRERNWLHLVLASFFFLLLVRLILWIAPRFRRLGLRPDADPACLPLIFLVLNALFLVNAPVSAWLDRQEEVEADGEGLELTRDPVAFCSLMVRLARVNQTDVDPPALVQLFWGHHPSLAQRIRFGLAWAERHGISVGPGAIPLPSPAEASGRRPTAR